MRSPLQVLVLLFRRTPEGTQYAVLRRTDDLSWQGVAGGAEDGETAEQTAFRETAEEAGVRGRLFRLDCFDAVPARCFSDRPRWPHNTFVVPQRYFAMDVTDCGSLTLSDEHVEHAWLPFQLAHDLLRYDGNRTALRELHERLSSDLLGDESEVRS